MLNAPTQSANDPIASEALGAPVAHAIPVAKSPLALSLAMRQLESRLSTLLAVCQDDDGFWRQFGQVMDALSEGLARADVARLNSHADFLLVRAGMSSWTLASLPPALAARR